MHHLIVPGISGSGDEHWQTLWQDAWGSAASRISPSSWDNPDLGDWCRALTFLRDEPRPAFTCGACPSSGRGAAKAVERAVSTPHRPLSPLLCPLASPWIRPPRRRGADSRTEWGNPIDLLRPYGCTGPIVQLVLNECAARPVIACWHRIQASRSAA